MIFYVLALCYKGSENRLAMLDFHSLLPYMLHQVALNISFKRMFSNHRQRYFCSFPKGNTGHASNGRKQGFSVFRLFRGSLHRFTLIFYCNEVYY